MSENAVVEALVKLTSFLGWAEQDNALYGSYRATEVVEALSVITGLSPAHIRRVAGTEVNIEVKVSDAD